MNNETICAIPDSFGMFIQGKAGRLFSQVYIPGRDKKYPVVILCHGFPGNERIMDFAVYLRERGFSTVHFHYRGSWGSDGNFTLAGCLEDAHSVLDMVLSDESGLYDTDNIFVFGHSWGGLVAANLLGTRKELKGGILLMPGDMRVIVMDQMQKPNTRDFMRSAFGEGCTWLKGYDCGQMESEVAGAPELFSIPAYAEGISLKPVLVATGRYDPMITREDHVAPLLKRIQELGGQMISEMCFETDHGLNRNRGQVKEVLAAYLLSLL